MAKVKIPLEAILDAAQRDDLTGFCLACGEESLPGTVEPDARGHECDACGASKVYGAEELLMMSA